MPGVDGLALCRRLRDEFRLTDLPILMLTAVQDAEVAAQALACGADDYLVKPMRLEGLLVKVQSLLRLARQQRLPSRFYHPASS
jgi:DNA-binding response OmpR family regulator